MAALSTQTYTKKSVKPGSTSQLVLKDVMKAPSVNDTPAQLSSASLISQSSSTAATLESWEVLKEKFEGAVACIEQLKASIVDMFLPNLEEKLERAQRRLGESPSRHQVKSASSRKSCVEKLPNVVKTTPVNIIAAPVADWKNDVEEEEKEEQVSLSNKKSSFSSSARNEVIKMWNEAVDEVEAQELASQASRVMAAKASLDEILKEHLILTPKDDEPSSEPPAQEAVPEPVRRQPTPPLYITPRYSSAQSFSSQISLRTISEGVPANFHSEFISPLATHSKHAVTSYSSGRRGFQNTQAQPQQEEEENMSEEEETLSTEESEQEEGDVEALSECTDAQADVDEPEENEEEEVNTKEEEEEREEEEEEEMEDEEEEIKEEEEMEMELAVVPYNSTKTRLHLKAKQDEETSVQAAETEVIDALPVAPPTSPVSSSLDVSKV